MDEKTCGLILRTRLLTETSLIVHWLTPDFGRIATVAKGARQPKSPFRGKLDLFHLGDLSFLRSRRSELHILREVKLRETHSELRKDIHLLQQAAYCAHLIEQTTETEAPLPEMFQLMSELLMFLPKFGGAPLPVFAFEVKLLVENGLRPDPSETALRPDTREVLDRLAVAPWDFVSRLKLSATQVTELRQFLHGYLIYHLGRLPAGRHNAVA